MPQDQDGNESSFSIFPTATKSRFNPPGFPGRSQESQLPGGQLEGLTRSQSARNHQLAFGPLRQGGDFPRTFWPRVDFGKGFRFGGFRFCHGFFARIEKPGSGDPARYEIGRSQESQLPGGQLEGLTRSQSARNHQLAFGPLRQGGDFPRTFWPRVDFGKGFRFGGFRFCHGFFARPQNGLGRFEKPGSGDPARYEISYNPASESQISYYGQINKSESQGKSGREAATEWPVLHLLGVRHASAWGKG